jgi:protease I
VAEKTLEGMRVAILATDGFEQVEVTVPMKALRKRGAEVCVVSLAPGQRKIRGMNLLVPGKKVRVDEAVTEADPRRYDALLLPGGFMSPDLLRQSDKALDFVRAFEREHKPIATLCHGPWLLVSAGLVAGRRLASWPGIADDVRNAGGGWEDQPVVRDDRWVSSRGPQDLPAFIEAMVALFAEHVPHRALVQRRAMATRAERRWSYGLAAVLLLLGSGWAMWRKARLAG